MELISRWELKKDDKINWKHHKIHMQYIII